MEHLYVIGGDHGGGGGGSVQMEELAVIEKNPTKYQIAGSGAIYTIFIVPQNVSTQYWEYNDDKSTLQNLGVMPAFTSSPDGGGIVYTRFYHAYLPGYIISSVALVLMLGYYILGKMKVLRKS
jgi:hypothetical protein